MIIVAAAVLGIAIIIATKIFVDCLFKIDHDSLGRHAAMNCLRDLVEELNDKFPGSHLYIEDRTDSVKVKGELKYYQKK